MPQQAETRRRFYREVGGRPAVQVRGRRAMVSSMHPDASVAGLEILRAGGNAVDAGLAVASTIAVTSHNWAGMAGDSVWLIHDAASGETVHLDGYGTCPAAMTPVALTGVLGLSDADLAAAAKEEPPGIRDTGMVTSLVPGTPAAWCAAWRRFASLPLPRLLDRAITLARDGVPVTDYLAQSFDAHGDKLGRFATSRDIFFRADGVVKQAGDTVTQRDLARTLERFAENPDQEFVSGETAKALLRQSRTSGALMTADDLRDYRAVWRDPVEGSYRGRRVVVTGPPTAGIHVLQALAILETFALPETGYHTPETLHLLIEATKLALVDRRRLGGDPDHRAIEVEPLLSRAYALSQAAAIDPNRATGRMQDAASAANETTHFTVVDEQGNVVSVTQTIGRDFGCGEVVEGTGLLMNDRSWWMSLRPGPNAVAPRHRANIGHAPTLVFSEDGPLLSVGSPGGFGIVQYVIQTVVNVLDHGLDIQSAIEAPRFRINDLETAVGCEARFDPDVLEALKALGHAISLYPEWSDRVGGVEGIEWCEDALLGGYDPRRNSLALGC